MIRKVLIACLLGLASSAVIHEASDTPKSTSTISITGKVTCGRLPLPETQIALWDNRAVVQDKFLGTAKPNKAGYFDVHGDTGKIGWEQLIYSRHLYLWIETRCKAVQENCPRIIRVHVPPHEIAEGEFDFYNNIDLASDEFAVTNKSC